MISNHKLCLNKLAVHLFYHHQHHRLLTCPHVSWSFTCPDFSPVLISHLPRSFTCPDLSRFLTNPSPFRNVPSHIRPLKFPQIPTNSLEPPNRTPRTTRSPQSLHAAQTHWTVHTVALNVCAVCVLNIHVPTTLCALSISRFAGANHTVQPKKGNITNLQFVLTSTNANAFNQSSRPEPPTHTSHRASCRVLISICSVCSACSICHFPTFSRLGFTLWRPFAYVELFLPCIVLFQFFKLIFNCIPRSSANCLLSRSKSGL